MHRGIAGNDFEILLIEPRHTSVSTSLPLHYRDPFDRLLVAQAMVEGIPLVSADAVLDQYPITRLW
jgi:PIN domain nuclease of toxin-antitoxin system